MEFLLNEKSLCGQFDTMVSFLHSIKPVIKCIELIHQNEENAIYKTTDFYDCNVTKTERLCDLKNCGISDELVRLKNSLDREVYNKPQWDDEPYHDISQKFIWNGEDVVATSLAEAAVRGSSLLSFDLEVFRDKKIEIENGLIIYEVDSVHTPKYLVKNYGSYLQISRKKLLKIMYEGTRLDCSTMEEKYGADLLEKSEFETLIITFNKFVAHESWDTIALDDGLEYKKYNPKERKKNWFLGHRYSGKTIMKFRFSDTMRCFGYRAGEKFRVLRLERDHTISNNG